METEEGISGARVRNTAGIAVDVVFLSLQLVSVGSGLPYSFFLNRGIDIFRALKPPSKYF
jgi:hypothetical protein